MKSVLARRVGVVLVLAAFMLPSVVGAQSTSDLQALISSLQQQLAALQAQLAQQQQSNGVAWCHTFNANLGVGNSGDEISALQTALEKEGLQIKGGWNPGSLDELTASAISAFQEKYASEVLTPVGLTAGTGYVGARTRAKLNSLYGCKATTRSVTSSNNSNNGQGSTLSAGRGTGSVAAPVASFTVNGQHQTTVTVSVANGISYLWTNSGGPSTSASWSVVVNGPNGETCDTYQTCTGNITSKFTQIGGQQDGGRLIDRMAQAGFTYTYTYTVTNSAGTSSDWVTVYAPPSSYSSQPIVPTPSSLSFSATAGGSNPAAQSLAVAISLSPAGSNAITLSTSYSSGSGWLAVTPTTMSTPGYASVQANVSGLVAGTYHATITVAANGQSAQVPVTLTVNQGTTSAPTISYLYPSSTTMTAVQSTAGQTVYIYGANFSQGASILFDNAALPTTAQGAVSQDANGTKFMSFSVPRSAAAVTATTHTVQLSQNGQTSNTATLYIAGVNAPIVPTPSSLSFSATAGGSNPAAQSLAVAISLSPAGSNAITLSTSYSSGSGWLAVTPTTMSTPGYASVQANVSGLVAGTYHATITVAANGQSAQVPVTLTVAAGASALMISSMSPSAMTLSALQASSFLSYGQTVVVSGSGFDSTMSVSFNGQAVSPTNVTASSFSFIIPGSTSSGYGLYGNMTAGTYPVTVTKDGKTVTVNFVVSGASSAPTISSFVASPVSITAGQSATLSWSVSGATSVTINNGVNAGTGSSVAVSPTANTTYTLTASNGTGSVTTTTVVTVAVAPPVAPAISSLSPSTMTLSALQASSFLSYGQTVTVSGSGFDSTMSVSFNGQAVTPTNVTATSFSFIIPGSSTSNYGLYGNMTAGTYPVSVTKGGQTATANFTVTSGSVAAPVASFTVNGQHQTTVTVSVANGISYLWTNSGGPSTSASWSVVVNGPNGETCDTYQTCTGNITSKFTQIGGQQDGGRLIDRMAQAGFTYTYTYTVTNSAGTSSDWVTIMAPQAALAISSLSPSAMTLSALQASSFLSYGQTVVVSGSGFDSTMSVSFNGQAVSPTNVTASSFSFIIPGSSTSNYGLYGNMTAGTYPVSVTKGGQTATSNFTVTGQSSDAQSLSQMANILQSMQVLVNAMSQMVHLSPTPSISKNKRHREMPFIFLGLTSQPRSIIDARDADGVQ